MMWRARSGGPSSEAKAKAGNSHAKRVMQSWAGAFTRSHFQLNLSSSVHRKTQLNS
jgi:hypothetical protein